MTVYIDCIVNASAGGALISNQGTVLYDITGDGTNAGVRPTNDPKVAGPSDPTEFLVRVPVPALSAVGLGVFLLLLAAMGALVLLRRIQ